MQVLQKLQVHGNPMHRDLLSPEPIVVSLPIPIVDKENRHTVWERQLERSRLHLAQLPWRSKKHLPEQHSGRCLSAA